MDRRSFLGAMSGAVILGGCTRLDEKGANPPATTTSIPGQGLAKAREEIRRDLFEHYIPFVDRHIVDHEHGGFMCAVDPEGNHRHQGKYIWFEGRGTWIFSNLCNEFGVREEWLAPARKSIEFVMAHKPEGDNLWPLRYTRDGQAQPERPGQLQRIYGDLFVAEGLAEYGLATGDPRYYDMAREIIFKCVRIYDQPDYFPQAGLNYMSEAPPLPGARVLGHWMVLVRLATGMLRQRPDDAAIAALADRCMEAIVQYHHNPEFDLTNELISHDMSRAEDFRAFCYLGHAIETIWMAMDEAARRGDDALFDLLAGRFRRHVEVAWDPVFDGILRSMEDIDAHWYTLDKTLWVQHETLVGAMLLYEKRRDPWALRLWERLYPYTREHFLIQGHELETWQSRADRRGRHGGSFGQYEFYHPARHMIMNLKALERLTA